MAGARYDDIVDWYQEFRPSLRSDELDALERLLGHGDGRCLDVGCGTGVSTAAVAGLGWSIVGVDVSAQLLEVPRAAGFEVVRASTDALPFDDASFDAAVSVWTHTDLDDFPTAMAEVTRVLRPSAPFVYVGGHPCFVGPHSRFLHGQGIPELHPGYAGARRYDGTAPGVADPEGLRARVGAVHLPLAGFLDAFLAAGLRLERFEELGRLDYPYMVALRARR